MRDTIVKVYQFSELTEKAKQFAKDRSAEIFGYNWSDDAIESLTKLAEHFSGKLKDYSVDFFASSYSSAKFDMPEFKDESSLKTLVDELGSYNAETLRGDGDCVLTGFCGDEDAIDGLRKAWHAGERDLNTLMQAAFKTWLEAAQADCRGQYEDEQFSEHCEANSYEFYEDGSMV